jgi:hypothetical protein
VDELEPTQREEQHELRDAEREQRGERPADRREDDEDDRERQDELERPAVGDDSWEHRRQDVVDDERDRVRQVKEVGEGPDPTVHERRRPTRGRGHEGGQPSRRDDSSRVEEPKHERRCEYGYRQQDERPRRSDPVVARGHGQQVRERQRSSDRSDREAPEQQGRDAAVCRRVFSGRGVDLHNYL